MSKIESFFGKPKKYKIMGEEIEILPLQSKDIDLLLALGTAKDSGAIKKLVNVYVEQVWPGTKKDVSDKLSVEFVTKFLEAITDVNGLSKK